ncbi:MAG TPA: GC-type dockerin domain-anchored protein [Phycisphaerales bacterium]|nr:GC-type dockerin domain-anchored protein [Phycisphaerales bacterium]
MLRNLLCAAGCVVSAAAWATAKSDGVLQQLNTRIEVSPRSIAPAVMTAQGVERIGDWLPYGGARGQPEGELVFDCFHSIGACDDGGLWYFGTAFCNGMATNDMTLPAGVDRARGAHAADLAWQWTCSGSGAEWCVIGVFTQESNPVHCERDSLDYSGWLLDFGTLTCNPGGYYYSPVDLGGGTWPLPVAETGSYVIAYYQSTGFALATCAQPMLWGTGDATGDACAPGTQEAEQLDDIAPLDGFHSVPTECYTYSTGGQTCPDPLGAAMAFWGHFIVECDVNGDGAVNTSDVLSFLNLWNSGSSAADSNGDGAIDTRDVLHFLARWNCCR